MQEDSVKIVQLIEDDNVYGLFAWKTYLQHVGRLSKEWKHPSKTKVEKPHKFSDDKPLDKTAAEKHRRLQNQRIIDSINRDRPRK